MSDLRSSQAARVSTRRYLLARDGRACVRCGDPISHRETPSIGHVIARALGGSDSPHNLRLEHLACNQRAGVDRDLARIISIAESEPVFHRPNVVATEPTFSSNGAGKRRTRPAVRRHLPEIGR